MVDVFGQDEIDLSKQQLCRSPRHPRREAANSRSGSFGTAKEDVIGHMESPDKREGAE
jgi:hypothetical protein